MKIRLLIALLIASVTITSCNDFLTEKEYDFIGPGLSAIQKIQKNIG